MKTLTALSLALMLVIAAPGVASAQDEPVETYTQAELDQMLAPIALYPDTVLSHILIGATYPLEIIRAYRWSQDHPDLSGAEAVDAVELQDWDPSVKALVAFPEILRRMHDDLAWTQRLGEAFLMQEEEVVATVQGLRERAYAEGNLRSDEHVEVVREENVIIVEPARPEVIYVPYYDPRVVYGRWWWSAYPPVYWSHPPGYHVSVNYWWGHGYRITPSWFYISSFHWTRRHVVVIHHHHYHKRPRHHFRSGRELVRYDGVRRWSHNPHHRRGAGYRAERLNDRFGRGGHYRDGQRQRGDQQVVRESRRDQRRQQVDFQRQAPQFQQRPERGQRQERRREDSPQVFRQTPQRVERQTPQFQQPQQRGQRQERRRQDAPQVQRQSPQFQQPQQRGQRQERRREDSPQVLRQTPQRVERQAPQFQQRPQRVERPAPQVQRPQHVERSAPQVQRQAPQVQRRADPPARRQAPAPRERRNAPERATEQDR